MLDRKATRTAIGRGRLFDSILDTVGNTPRNPDQQPRSGTLPDRSLALVRASSTDLRMWTVLFTTCKLGMPQKASSSGQGRSPWSRQTWISGVR